MGNYKNLNVLNQKSFLNDLDSVDQVAAMINNGTSNRSQRRRLEKTLNKVERIQAKCETVAREKANIRLEERADQNFMYVFGCIGLTLNEDYHWKEDPDQEHGQITSFFDRLTKKMEKYASAGLSTEDILALLDERTGIQLVSTGGKNSKYE